MGTTEFKIEGVHYAGGLPVSIQITDGIISEIHDISNLSSENKNLIIAPGLIDNQINGYANVDFSGNDLLRFSVTTFFR